MNGDQLLLNGSSVDGAAAAAAAPLIVQRPVVLQAFGREQRKLERQLDKITAQLKMQQYCMHT